MALITCEECGKKVSSRAPACIHCGCPIEQDVGASTEVSTMVNIQGKDIDISSVIDYINKNEIILAIKALRELSGLGLAEAKAYVDSLRGISRPAVRNKAKKSADIVSCPKCGSTQIQIVPRKWDFWRGLATNKVDRVCIKCTHKF